MKKLNLILIGLLIGTCGYAQELEKFSEDGKYGFRDTNGKVIVPAKYDGVEKFSEGLAKVKTGHKYGLVNNLGNEIVPPKYWHIGDFSENLAKVTIRSQDNSDIYGYINKAGKVVIPVKFSAIGDFSEGLAYVKGEDFFSKWGFIDKAGKEVIPLKYEEVESFLEGLACVRYGGESYCIDKTGKVAYKSREMKIIWEKLFASRMKKINNYRLRIDKHSKNSSSLQPKPPYLVVSVGLNNTDKRKISFLYYSGEALNEQSINTLNTLIVQYDYPEHSKLYRPVGDSGNTDVKRVTSHGSYLIYFDITSETFIGHDVLSAPILPDQTPDRRDRFNGVDVVLEKIGVVGHARSGTIGGSKKIPIDTRAIIIEPRSKLKQMEILLK